MLSHPPINQHEQQQYDDALEFVLDPTHLHLFEAPDVSPPPTLAVEEGNNDTDLVVSQVACVCFRVGYCIWGLGYMAFHIMVIYALVMTHTQSVTDACGVSLWVFLLVHLLLPVVLLCLLCCAVLYVYMLAANLMLDAKQIPFYYWVVAVGAFVYFATLCGVGAHLTDQASRNEACKTAVVSATHMMHPPLLTTLGWVYVGLDGASLLLSVGLMVALGYVQYFLL